MTTKSGQSSSVILGILCDISGDLQEQVNLWCIPNMLGCPWDHTCASFINLKKKVLFFCVHLKGANSYGQLGLGHKDDVLIPQALKDVSCKCQDIVSIDGGGGHSALITGKNTALAWSVWLLITFFLCMFRCWFSAATSLWLLFLSKYNPCKTASSPPS